MTMFNSIERTDSRPWRNPYDGSRWPDDGGWAEMVFDPRPEHTNRPNLILVEFRRAAKNYSDSDFDLAVNHYLVYLDNDVYDWPGNDEEKLHARLVLERLAFLCAEVVS